MKEYVTLTEFLATLNQVLARYPECEGCEITGAFYHLQTPSDDGTNWSDTVHIRGGETDQCVQAAWQEIGEVAHRYALRNDNGSLLDLVFMSDTAQHVMAFVREDEHFRAHWFVRVDHGAPKKAFPFSPDDRDPQRLKAELSVWLQHGALPTRLADAPPPAPTPFRYQIAMPERFIYKSFQIDANRINARGALQSMNQLEKWRENGVIHVDMSEVAHGEARSGGDARRISKALGYTYSMTLASTHQEEEQLRSIAAILFPQGALDQNQRNDVEIVFNSIKYHRILVTADGDSRSQPGGILGNRAQLELLGARVMRDVEAVAYIREEILRRDERARRTAELTGVSLPPWVGRD